MSTVLDRPGYEPGIHRQLVAYDAVFRVHERCPYCGSGLFAWSEGWTKRDDHTWEADGTLMVDCDSAPDLDSPAFDEWVSTHSYMPYVYMLPIAIRITAWVNKRFDFDMDTRRREGEPPIGGPVDRQLYLPFA